MSKKWQSVSVLSTITGNLGFRTCVSFDTPTGHQEKRNRTISLRKSGLAAFFLYLEHTTKTQKSKDFFLALFGYLSTFKILIFSFFKRNAYATRDTTLSNAFPMPNSNAIPISDGVHTPVM